MADLSSITDTINQGVGIPPASITTPQGTTAPTPAGYGNIVFPTEAVAQNLNQDVPTPPKPLAADDVIGTAIQGVKDIFKGPDTSKGIVGVAEWMGSPTEAIENTIAAEKQNVLHNDMSLSIARDVSGNTQHAQQIEQLHTQQANLNAQLGVLLNNPSKNSSQIAALQSQVSAISSQLDSLNTSHWYQKWEALKDPVNTMRTEWAGLKDTAETFLHSPFQTFKNFGNSMLSSPEMFFGGEILSGARGLVTGMRAAKLAGEGAELGTATAADLAKDGVWSLDQDEQVLKASMDMSTKAASYDKMGTALASHGIAKNIAMQAALFTPLNLAQVYDQKGEIAPNDVIRAAFGSIPLMAAYNLGKFQFSSSPASLEQLLNDAAANHASLADMGAELGVNMKDGTPQILKTSADKSEAAPATKAATKKAQAEGMETTEITLPNQAMATLQVIAKAGGSYRAADLISPGVQDAYYKTQTANLFAINQKIGEYTTSQADTLASLPDGVHSIGDGFITAKNTTATGKPSAIIHAIGGDKTVSVFYSHSQPTAVGLRRYISSLSSLANDALESGRTLSSEYAVRMPDAEIWRRKMVERGYTVRESPFTIYDADTNELKTTNGESPFEITGRQGGAEAQAQEDLKESAQALQNQAGRITPEMAKFGIGAAATLGMGMYGYSQGGWKPAIRDALVGALGGIVAPILWRGTGDWVASKQVGKMTNDEAIGHLNTAAQKLNQLPVISQRIRVAINSLAGGSDNLYHNLMQTDEAKPMTASEQEAFNMVHTILQHLGARAKDSGIIKNMIDEYFMRWWKPTPGSPLEKTWNKVNLRMGRTLSPGPEGFQQATALGLQPITHDVGALMEHYINGMYRSIVLKETAGIVGQLKDTDGMRLVMPALEAPKHYMQLEGNAFPGMKAHPDIALPINMLYDFKDAGLAGKIYDTTTAILKRGLLSFSLFHPKNLAMNYLMQTGMPGGLKDAFNPNSQFQKALKGEIQGSATDDILDSARYLTYAVGSTSEDLSNNAYYGFLDKLSSKLGVAGGQIPAAAKSVSKFFDRLAFEQGQNYFKYITYSKLRENMEQAALSRHSLNPDKYDLPNSELIKQRAARITNDMYGSQNYYLMVNSINNGFVKHLVGEAFSPTGRRNLQRLFLAPDWTVSVLRSFTGIAHSNLGAARWGYARYLIGVGSFYLASAGAQYAFTGTFPWQNGQPGYITFPDGSRLQWDKQLAEAAEYMEKPGQAFLNKIGPLPRMLAQGVLNKAYLAPGEVPKIYNKTDSPLNVFGKVFEHSLVQSTPIGAQQGASGGWRGALGSETGFPFFPAHHSVTAVHVPLTIDQKIQRRIDNMERKYQ